MAHHRWRDIKRKRGPEAEARVQAMVDEANRKIRLLRTLRQERGLTQVELAELLEMDQGNLSAMERREDIKLSTLLKYIDALGGDVTLTVSWRDGGETKFAI